MRAILPLIVLSLFGAAPAFALTGGGSKSVDLDEQSSVPGGSPASGNGKIWVRDDAPNVLVYTDDGGTDTVLGQGTVSGSGSTNKIPKFTGASTIGDSTFQDDGTNLTSSTSTPATRTFRFANTNSGGTASTEMQLEVQAGAGDPFLSWDVSGTQQFAMGVDNDDSDVWKFSKAANLGSDIRMTFDASSDEFSFFESDVLVGGNKLNGFGSRTLLVSQSDDEGDRATVLEIQTNGSSNILFTSQDSTENNGRLAQISSVQDTVDVDAGRLQFYTTDADASSTERMRIDSAGHVGIGRTPDSWGSSWSSVSLGGNGGFMSNTTPGASNGLFSLQNAYFDGTNYKYISTDEAGRVAMSDGNFAFANASSGTAGNNITFTERFKIDSNGVVRVGAGGFTDTIGKAGIKLDNGTSNTPGIHFYDGNDTNFGIDVSGADLRFVDNLNEVGGTVVARIDRNGLVEVGGGGFTDTIPGTGIKLDNGTSNTPKLFFYDGNNTNFAIDVQGSDLRFTQNNDEVGGTVVAKIERSTEDFFTNDGTVSSLSDRRLKQKVEELNADILGKVMRLRPKKFEYKRRPGDQRVGFIAQDVEQVFPDLVHETNHKGGKYKAIKHAWGPILIKAIQLQQTRIEALENQQAGIGTGEVIGGAVLAALALGGAAEARRRKREKVSA